MDRILLLLLFWVEVCFVHPRCCPSVLQGRLRRKDVQDRSLCLPVDVFCFRLRGGQTVSQAHAEPDEPQAGNKTEGVQSEVLAAPRSLWPIAAPRPTSATAALPVDEDVAHEQMDQEHAGALEAQQGLGSPPGTHARDNGNSSDVSPHPETTATKVQSGGTAPEEQSLASPSDGGEDEEQQSAKGWKAKQTAAPSQTVETDQSSSHSQHHEHTTRIFAHERQRERMHVDGTICTIVVQGLPEDCKAREVYAMARFFEGFKFSTLFKPGNKRHMNAFVTFRSSSAAQQAMERLQGIVFDPRADGRNGHVLTVAMAARTSHPPRDKVLQLHTRIDPLGARSPVCPIGSLAFQIATCGGDARSCTHPVSCFLVGLPSRASPGALNSDSGPSVPSHNGHNHHLKFRSERDTGRCPRANTERSRSNHGRCCSAGVLATTGNTRVARCLVVGVRHAWCSAVMCKPRRVVS